MVENKMSFANKIDAKEVNQLLINFWGEGSPLASYTGDLVDFSTANHQLDTALSISTTNYTKKTILDSFVGKTISLGIRHGGELVAHSALKIHSQTELETTGSIISDSFQGKHLMGEINVKKKELIRKFSLLRCQPVSYVLLGSKSVEHGYNIFDIPNIGLTSWFCNIGPYVFNRQKDHSIKETDLVSDLGLEMESSILSSSSKIVGIRKDNPPLIAKNLEKYLPQFWLELLTKYPKIEDKNAKNTNLIDGQNTVYDTSSNMTLYIIRTKIEDWNKFIDEVTIRTLGGKTVMFEIPIKTPSLPALEQMLDVIFKSVRGISFVPTGLTIIDGYWSICISTLLDERLSHYRNSMYKIADIYKGSLKDLATISYNHLLKSIVT